MPERIQEINRNSSTQKRTRTAVIVGGLAIVAEDAALMGLLAAGVVGNDEAKEWGFVEGIALGTVTSVIAIMWIGALSTGISSLQQELQALTKRGENPKQH